MKYAVFIPAGPNAHPEFIRDTIESAIAAIDQRAIVAVGDDSGSGKFKLLEDQSRNIFVIDAPEIAFKGSRYSTQGRLFVKKSRLLRSVLERFEFDLLLCLDDDALVLNNKFTVVAEGLFKTRLNAGILARFALNHEFQPVSYQRQMELLYGQISRNPFSLKGTVSPVTQVQLRKTLKPVLLEAIKNGYIVGTAFIGGSWIISRECLLAITKRAEIDDDILCSSPNCDDDLFTVFAYACNFKVYDILTDPPIFYISWKTLPLSPTELVARGASIVHSVRDSEYGTEREIREFFRSHGPRNGSEPKG